MAPSHVRAAGRMMHGKVALPNRLIKADHLQAACEYALRLLELGRREGQPRVLVLAHLLQLQPILQNSDMIAASDDQA